MRLLKDYEYEKRRFEMVLQWTCRETVFEHFKFMTSFSYSHRGSRGHMSSSWIHRSWSVSQRALKLLRGVSGSRWTEDYFHQRTWWSISSCCLPPTKSSQDEEPFSFPSFFVYQTVLTVHLSFTSFLSVLQCSSPPLSSSSSSSLGLWVVRRLPSPSVSRLSSYRVTTSPVKVLTWSSWRPLEPTWSTSRTTWSEGLRGTAPCATTASWTRSDRSEIIYSFYIQSGVFIDCVMMDFIERLTFE